MTVALEPIRKSFSKIKRIKKRALIIFVYFMQYAFQKLRIPKWYVEDVKSLFYQETEKRHHVVSNSSYFYSFWLPLPLYLTALQAHRNLIPSIHGSLELSTLIHTRVTFGPEFLRTISSTTVSGKHFIEKPYFWTRANTVLVGNKALDVNDRNSSSQTKIWVNVAPTSVSKLLKSIRFCNPTRKATFKEILRSSTLVVE